MDGQAMSLDAALMELVALSACPSLRQARMQERVDRQRHQQVAGPSGSSLRASERPLQPSQAWNKPSASGGLEAEGWGWPPPSPDSENNENSYKVERNRLKAVPARLGIAGGGINILQMNPQFITSVAVDMADEAGNAHRSSPGRLVHFSKPSHWQHYLKPYSIPGRREERVRTKSENADTECPNTIKIVEVPIPLVTLPPPSTPLFRSRSLEDVRSPPSDLEELDVMSLEIQRLHVNE